MMRAPSTWSSVPRRGMILLVVIALLTLFAVVGLSFVMYANSAATASRLYRESESLNRPDVEPELLFSYFMGQLVYDVPDDERGVYSGLRGHSLGRSMFGLNYHIDPDGTLNPDNNDVPYNGTGRLHHQVSLPGSGDSSADRSFDEYYLVNYTYFPRLDPTFLRDPERPGQRSGLQDNRRPFFGGFNASYTYPDLNNMFLAAMKADGTMLTSSFHRDWLFRDQQLNATWTALKADGNPLDPTSFNQNWLTRHGKYLTLRPRPLDQISHAQVIAHDQAVPAVRQLGWPLLWENFSTDPVKQQELINLIAALQGKGQLFPYPEDQDGDVKNMIGAAGGNDSIWIDLDFPVITAPDGRKFKPLFAPLIVDLDNRVNLNVHGNVKGKTSDLAASQTTYFHTSNQGWGPWEVNPGQVLNKDASEYTNLLMGGNPSVQGRYGREDHPHAVRNEPTKYKRALPHNYAQVDFDATDQRIPNERIPTGPLHLPDITDRTLRQLYNCFPVFPSGYTFGLSFPKELEGHPNLFNPFSPTLPDRSFAISNMEALLRYQDTGAPALTSELLRLCPNNLGSGPDASRRRGLLTVRSFDVDRPGITPWFWPSVLRELSSPTIFLEMGVGESSPKGTTVPFPPIGPERHLGGDFLDNDFRADKSLSALRRLDLNRYLPAYPAPDESTGQIREADLNTFRVAQRARQYMAMEIFECLVKVTGANSKAKPPPNSSDPDNKQWNALRWLAQLAVNVVDYIDNDDYMTPFQWFPIPWEPESTGVAQLVFGVELPRVLINEVYAQYNGFWVELYNPLPAENPMSKDPTLSYQGRAKLAGAYQLYIVDLGSSTIGVPENILENPEPYRTKRIDFAGDVREASIYPSGGLASGPEGTTNVGYFVVGPGPFGDNPDKPVLSLTCPELEGNTIQLKRPAVLLRRLACPDLPENNTPGLLYNPYITVDYMHDVSVCRGGADDPAPKFSRGRSQPFAGFETHRQYTQDLAGDSQQPANTFSRVNDNPVDPPPYDWFVHLDRHLVSPLELLFVSACKPHELTHLFMTGDTAEQRFNHLAPWFDSDLKDAGQEQSHRLYRALEFLGVRSQMVGMMAVPPINGEILGKRMIRIEPGAAVQTTPSGGTWEIYEGCTLLVRLRDSGATKPVEEVVRVKRFDSRSGTLELTDNLLIMPVPSQVAITPNTISERIPGKININTIWDEETFFALCDPSLSNNFTLEDIEGIYEKMTASRTPNIDGRPGLSDRPFRSLATGLTPYSEQTLPSAGLQDTILRSTDSIDQKQLLFEIKQVNQDHPYLRMELLNKIFNNVTTRSNVFAVWLTVGFFEVTDDSTRPVKLGRELGRSENRQIRHRMFGIVDRSVLTSNPGPQPRFDPRAERSPGVEARTGRVVPYFSIIE